MSVTPDRFPGPLLETDEVQLSPNPGDPEITGTLRFDGSAFLMKDATGVFNPRTGGASIGVDQLIITTENGIVYDSDGILMIKETA